MIAAIYARKSTEQHGVADDAKSVARQIEHARAYAERRGWKVAEEHVYSDDGISGAEFVKRPDYRRLMDALHPRPPFQVLVMSEESRLGRDQIETAYALKQIIDAGVRVFVYLDDREISLADATQTVMVQLRGFGAAIEREQASKRTYDAMVRKAKALQVTGGRVYGYANVDVLGEPDQDGRQRRLHVARKINPEQADVVRRIFHLYADGLGLKKIAKALNAEHVAPPRQDARGWAPTAIREMLHREMYRGVLVWNRSQKVMRRGTKKQRRRDESEWLRIEAPELRIVSDEMWNAVQARLEKASESFGRVSGGRFFSRPSALDGDSPYLLTGFTKCSICGGALGTETRAHGSGPSASRKRVMFYGCTYRRHRGHHVCSNGVVLRSEVLDGRVREVMTEALDGDMVAEMIENAIDAVRASRGSHENQRAEIARELQAVEQRLGRLVEALVSGGALETVVAKIKVEEARKRDLAAQLADLQKADRVTRIDPAEVRRDVVEIASEVRRRLAGPTAQARQMLRKIVTDKLNAEPIERDGRRGYRLTGELAIWRLLPTESVSTNRPLR